LVEKPDIAIDVEMRIKPEAIRHRAMRAIERRSTAAMATSKPDNRSLSRERSVSVFIPVLNEEHNLEPTVARLIEALTVTVEDYEIIIVDDGSSDGTCAVADALAAENSAIRVLHNSRNMGLGYCFAQGYREARKNFFVYIPGDNTWPYRSFIELLGNLGRADVITSYAINPDVRPFGRRIVSRLYTEVLNLLFGRPLHYFNGLTIYPVEFLRRDPVTTFGFGFQAEVLLKAVNSGLSYIEVGLPIDARTAGGSKAVTLANIHSVLATLVRLFFELRDIGCGPGFIVKHLPAGIRYDGFDIEKRYIDYARKRFHARGSFHCRQFDLSCAASLGCADVVMMNGLLHHLDNTDASALLRDVRRALKPTGVLFTLDGCLRDGNLWVANWVVRHDRGRHVRSEDEYRQLLKEHFGTVQIFIRDDLALIQYPFAIGLARPI
jgi:glycosyltransferase involved in cell wall biosynthesis